MGVRVVDQIPTISLDDVIRQIQVDTIRGVLNRKDWDHGPGKRTDRSSKHIWIWGARSIGYYPGCGQEPPSYDECWRKLVSLTELLKMEVEIKWLTAA